jgi:hypothetical protein
MAAALAILGNGVVLTPHMSGNGKAPVAAYLLSNWLGDNVRRVNAKTVAASTKTETKGGLMAVSQTPKDFFLARKWAIFIQPCKPQGGSGPRDRDSIVSVTLQTLLVYT